MLLLCSGRVQALDKRPYSIRIRRPGQPQCPAKRLTADRQLQTLQVGMQMRTPSRQPPTRIGNENALDSHDAQQVG